MTFYVIATDRAGSEMRPGGIVLEKHVILCTSREQAEKVSKMLKGRPAKFSAVQMTPNLPVLNPAIYRPVHSEGAVWLQGR